MVRLRRWAFGVMVGASLGCLVRAPVMSYQEVPVDDLDEVEHRARYGEVRVRVVRRDGSELEGVLLPSASTRVVKIDTGSEEVYLPVEDVLLMYVRAYDPVASDLATAGASTAVTVLVVAALVGIPILIFAALKTSCPYVIVEGADGQRLIVGEGYSGAVVRNLARSDRVPVPDLGVGEVGLWLANGAPETQYTDAAWLEVVDHPPGTRAVATVDELRILGEPVAATRVEDLDGVDQTDRAAPGRPDVWFTDLEAAVARAPRPTGEGLVATFDEVPASPVLDLEVQSSPWLDHLSLQAWMALGRHVERVQARGTDPERAEDQLRQMLESGIHLRVEVRQGDEPWRDVAYQPPVGWVAPRHVAVPLPGVDASRPVQVRVSGGVGFVFVHGLALAPDLGRAEAQVLPATSALTLQGSDERGRLRAIDDDPNVLGDRGEEVHLTFAVPERPEGTERSTFLFTHGYYEVHHLEGAKAQPAALLSLKDPAALGGVGLDLYAQLRERMDEPPEAP